jgi:hypothetical protein
MSLLLRSCLVFLISVLFCIDASAQRPTQKPRATPSPSPTAESVPEEPPQDIETLKTDTKPRWCSVIATDRSGLYVQISPAKNLRYSKTV